jgi:uncharacterized protein (DUF1697 family)
MITHLALLRGINVSGQHDKNGCIKTTLENIGFTKVQTYIQSGNVFVTTEEENAKVGFIIKELFKVFEVMCR